MASSAERQRRHKARLRAGKMCLCIEVDQVNLVEALLADGYLPSAAEELEGHARTRAIAQATETFLAQAIVVADFLREHPEIKTMITRYFQTSEDWL